MKNTVNGYRSSNKRPGSRIQSQWQASISLLSLLIFSIFLLFAAEVQAADGAKRKIKNYDEVINILRQNPNDVDALTAQAIYLAGQPEAQQAIAKVRQLDPNYERIYAAMLWDNVVRNDMQGIANTLKIGRERRLKDPYVKGYFVVGDVYLKLKKAHTAEEVRAATKDLNSAIKLSNNDERIIQYAGELLLDNSLVKESLPVFDRALKINAKSERTLYLKSIAFSRIGKTDEAVRYADMVIKENPDNSLAYQAKGYALNLAGRYSEAIEANNQAVKLSPDFVVAWSQLGEAQERLGKSTEANDSFQKAVDVNLDKAENWYNLLNWGQFGRGRALLGMEKTDEALKSFDKALAINPRYEDALIGKARVLGKQGRFNPLVKILRDVEKLNPESPHLKGTE